MPMLTLTKRLETAAGMLRLGQKALNRAKDAASWIGPTAAEEAADVAGLRQHVEGCRDDLETMLQKLKRR